MSDFVSKLHIEKLNTDGSNWVSSRDRMMWVLQFWGLLEHLTSTVVTANYTAIRMVNNITPQMKWDNDEATTMHVIAASIPNSIFTNVKSKPNTKEVWDALKALYEGRTQMVLVKTSQQLQTTHCGEDDSVRDHFDYLANLREQLAAMGKTITDNEYASILLGSLPESYLAMLGSITAAAELSGRAVSSAIVVKIATDEYDCRTLQNGKTKDEAFATSPQKKGKKHDVKCENCHKKGHIRAKCWAKGGGNEEGGPKC